MNEQNNSVALLVCLSRNEVQKITRGTIRNQILTVQRLFNSNELSYLI